MADKKSLLSTVFGGLFGSASKQEAQQEVEQAINSDFTLGYDAVSVSTLLGSGKRQARSRAQIYEKYHYMMGDPLISTALRLHVTQALGGHETTGDVVFIEAKETINGKKNNQEKIVAELQQILAPMFNRISHHVAFNAAGFGDAYARVFTKDKVGVQAIWCDEMMHPPLLQPYEKAGVTVGYAVAAGERLIEKMTIRQIARMKMPRMLYTAQLRALDKSIKTALEKDDPEAAPILPALVGGSFLEAAEEPYDNLINSIVGMVGQRILNSIDENMIGVNLTGTTKEQQKLMLDSIKAMLTKSKQLAEDAIKAGKPVTSRTYHVVPTAGEKNLVSVSQFNGTSGATSISIEDVMFHARLLAGALGIDLSMLGFADLLSGGLGDGGFFRTSAQAAERSRIIRTALTDFFDSIVDLHTFSKYGWVFEDGERPYVINFYGSISALEAEKQEKQEKATNALALLTQTLMQLKDLGLSEDATAALLEKVAIMDQEMAEMLAKALKESKENDREHEKTMQGGGGFGQPGGDPTVDQQQQDDGTADANYQALKEDEQ